MKRIIKNIIEDIKEMWPLILLGALFIIIIAFISIYIANEASVSQLFNVRGALGFKSPGTLFAFIVGILTLLGLLIAVKKIEELTPHMVNFDVLIGDLIYFLKNTKDNEEIYALFQTPLVGNITFDPDPRSSDGTYNPERIGKAGDMAELLRERIKNLRLICLGPKDLEKFYLSLQPTTGLDEKTLKNKAKEAEKWLSSLDEMFRKKNIRYYNTLEDSPMFHLLFTKRKGFLFLPLFNPKEDKGIEMFSFVPKDPTIIKSHFIKVFNHYWNDRSSEPEE